MFFVLGYAVGSQHSDIKIHIHLDLTLKLFDSKNCRLFNPLAVMHVEAILFTADKIQHDRMLGNYTLALKFFDTCQMTKMNPYYLVVLHGTLVVGPYSSDLSMFTTNFLSIFSLSTISFGASANRFYEKRQDFEEFFSTVPPDSLGSNVYRDLAVEFDWEYTMLLETNNEDGLSMASDVIVKLHTQHFCVIRNKIENDAIEQTYHQQMKIIINQPKIKTVFLFLSFKGCSDFFQATIDFPEREKLREKQFVLGTSCGAGVNIHHQVQRLFEGMLAVQVEDSQPEEFTDYFAALLPRSKTRNIFYFNFYWEFTHNCTLTSKRKEKCKEERSDQFSHFAPVRPVMNALFAAAEGVKMYLDTHNRSDRVNAVRTELDRFMPLVNFNLFGKNFSYNKDKQILSNYDVLRFEKVDSNKFSFTKIGSWDVEKWKRNGTALILKRNVSIPNSKCSFPCEEREIREYYALGSCCWECKRCPTSSIVVNNKCQSCALGFKANLQQNKCNKLPTVTISPTVNYSIWVIMVSALELVAIILIACVYFKHYSSHVIKTSSRELALFSLFGLFLMLVVPVLLVLKPTTTVCYTQKILIGMSLTCCYSPLVLKTNRVFRIFASSNKFKLRRLVFVSMRSQFLLISAMVGIELLIGTFWILTDKPVITTSYPPQQDMIIKQCNKSGTGTFLNLIFPIALMVASTYWAFKTRNLPETFSEIKSIGVTMYITLFLATFAFTFIFILDGISQRPFIEMYVICFTLQAIVLVNLIGQYAMKIKSLYDKPNNMEQVQEKTNTEFSIVMTNRFHSPNASPKVKRAAASIYLKAYKIPSPVSRGERQSSLWERKRDKQTSAWSAGGPIIKSSSCRVAFRMKPKIIGLFTRSGNFSSVDHWK